MGIGSTRPSGGGGGVGGEKATDEGPDAAAERKAPAAEHATDGLCLSGCSAAAYLLWLVASGNFSSVPSSEANVIRDRMAAPAPTPATATQQSGGASSSSGGGLGGVAAVSELLLRRLMQWKDEDAGDCVAEVRTSLPPPPQVPLVAQTPEVFRITAGPGPGSALSGQQFRSHAGPDSVSAGSDALRHRDAGGPHGSPPSSLPRLDIAAVNAEAGRGEGASPGRQSVAGDVEEARLAAGLSQLRVGSAGLLLTPRQSRPDSAQASTPQRYQAASSEDEEDDAGREDGAGGGHRRDTSILGDAPGGSRRGSGGGGTSDALNATQDTVEDLDMSNIIDSSVELTGKEQLMQAIQDAAAAIAQHEASGLGGDGPPDGAAGRTPVPTQDGASSDPAASSAAVGPNHPDSPAVGYGTHSGAQAAREAVPSPGAAPDGEGQLIATATTAEAATQAPSSGRGHTSAITKGGGSPGDPANRQLEALRPSPLLILTAASPFGYRPPPEPARLSLAARLGAVRYIRSRRPPPPAPPPVEVQALICNCVGLLAAVALSAGGAKSICSCPGLLSHVASLLAVPQDAPESAAAASVSGSGLELRQQLLALLTNLTMHTDAAEAVAAAAATDGGPSLAEALFATARLSCRLLGSSPTSWRGGQQLLEACFDLMANLQRANAAISAPSPDLSGGPTDSYTLATQALSMQLPGTMGRPDRVKLRSAAARMLDSAIAAYEGIGQSVPQAAVSELVALLELGGSKAAAVAAGMGAEAAESAACDAAGALWQVMAAGQLHPDNLLTHIQGPLSTILRRRSAGAELSRRCLGLVSCLARSELVSRRLWATPLVTGVMAVHARAKAAGEGDLERVAVELECRLEYDSNEEAIMLVPRDE
ncbi:hypothetical protein GPECTOR_1g6 [Gonium pectorale]|uniref:Uncharacterized protein n=1 Tax=Gonium pectorale TaxID=33097 RepID=A0A150H3Q7_GONPE|nr:hypothetical protein GPECTOR_1g6 [Gonium pectorale]|eukprot:KXZ56665.1 hypothetical protein GPECTOR_1g6 [Gonium pectorale]